MANYNLLQFDKDLVQASELSNIDKRILIDIGFPCGPYVPIAYSYFEQEFKVIQDQLFGEKVIIGIAKDKGTDTFIVIATSNNALYFYDQADHKFTFINSNLNLFISFQNVCQNFFTGNPEFQDIKYTNDKYGLNKINNLKKQLTILDEKAFENENYPWSFFIEELTYL